MFRSICTHLFIYFLSNSINYFLTSFVSKFIWIGVTVRQDLLIITNKQIDSHLVPYIHLNCADLAALIRSFETEKHGLTKIQLYHVTTLNLNPYFFRNSGKISCYIDCRLMKTQMIICIFQQIYRNYK